MFEMPSVTLLSPHLKWGDMHSRTSFSSKTEILFTLDLLHVLFPQPDNLFNLLHLTNFYSPFCAQLLNHVQLFATPWTVALQDPLSMEFSRQEYWSGLPCPSPGDLPNQGIKPTSPAFGSSLPLSHQGCPLTL